MPVSGSFRTGSRYMSDYSIPAQWPANIVETYRLLMSLEYLSIFCKYTYMYGHNTTSKTQHFRKYIASSPLRFLKPKKVVGKKSIWKLLRHGGHLRLVHVKWAELMWPALTLRASVVSALLGSRRYAPSVLRYIVGSLDQSAFRRRTAVYDICFHSCRLQRFYWSEILNQSDKM